MANLYRLILILFFLLPSISKADYWVVDGNFSGARYSSADTACSSRIGEFSGFTYSGPDNFFQGTSADCKYINPSNGNTFYPYSVQKVVADCAQNETKQSDGSCVANAPDCNTKTDQVVQSGTSDVPVTPQVGCHDGCEVLWNPTSSQYVDCGGAGSSGVMACSYVQDGSYKYTGSTCSGSDTPTTNVKVTRTAPCPVCDCIQAGKTWGTVNGLTVCVTAGTPGSGAYKINNAPSTTTSASTNTNTSGGTTTTTNTTNTSTTNYTFNSDGTVTASTTAAATNADGSTGSSTTSKTMPFADYCQQNPTAKECKDDKGSFGGACGAGFTCDSNDAVTCAIATEEYRRNCQLFDNQTPLSQLGQSLTDGTDPNASNDPTTHKATVDLPSSLNEDAHFSGELQDETIPIGSLGSITLPFSKLNSLLGYMGMIVLAFAYISAVKIVGVS